MTPEFSRKQINSKTLGERLREIRERAGVSLEEIANAIKVNKKYLRQIENDDYENMPSEIYVRGFLRNYANFLRISAKDVLRIYEKERGIENNIKKTNKKEKKNKKINIPTVTLSSRMVFGIFFGIFVVLIGWYFYKEAGRFSATPRLLISKPVNNSIIEHSSTELVGVTDVGNKVTVNGQAIFVNERGEFGERIALKKGINELIVKVVNKFGQEITKTIKLSAQYSEDFPEKNNDAGQEDKKEEDTVKVIIKAKEVPVWIAVKVDGTVVYRGTVLVGAEQVFEGREEISITSGQANQTLIKLNNEQEFRELSPNEGVIRDVIFSKNDLNEEGGGKSGEIRQTESESGQGTESIVSSSNKKATEEKAIEDER